MKRTSQICDGRRLGDGAVVRALMEHQLPSPDLGQQRAGVPDISRGLAALDLGEDRLEQRAGIALGAPLSPP